MCWYNCFRFKNFNLHSRTSEWNLTCCFCVIVDLGNVSFQRTFIDECLATLLASEQRCGCVIVNIRDVSFQISFLFESLATQLTCEWSDVGICMNFWYMSEQSWIVEKWSVAMVADKSLLPLFDQSGFSCDNLRNGDGKTAFHTDCKHTVSRLCEHP